MKQLSMKQVAGTNNLYWRFSLPYCLRSLERLEVHLLDFYGVSPHLAMEDITNDEARQLRRTLSDHGIQAQCLIHPAGWGWPNLASESETVRRRTVNIYRRCIELAVIFGAEKIQMLGGRCGYDLPVEMGDAWAIESLRQLAPLAEREGVTMVLEASSWHNTTVGRSTQQMLWLLEQVGSPRLKTMLDVCSVHKLGENFGESYRRIGNGRMAHVHFCDGTPMGHLVPGDGVLPVDACLQALDEGGYSGVIAFEIDNERYDADPHQAMARAMEYMRQRLNP